MKNITILTILFTALVLSACTKQSNENKADTNKEIQEVKQVMKAYKDGLQKLTTDGLVELFSNDSEVFESGGVEGSFSHYLEHHLAPELKYFSNFDFTDYKIDVKIAMPYAFTTETYIYHIGIKPNEEKGVEAKTISRQGVATSILKKTEGKWKIIKTHTSARNYKKND